MVYKIGDPALAKEMASVISEADSAAQEQEKETRYLAKYLLDGVDFERVDVEALEHLHAGLITTLQTVEEDRQARKSVIESNGKKLGAIRREMLEALRK